MSSRFSKGPMFFFSKWNWLLNTHIPGWYPTIWCAHHLTRAVKTRSAFFAQQMTLDSWFSHFATILGAGMTISYMLSDYMVNDDGVDLGVCAVAFPNETLKFWWRRDRILSPTSESFSPLNPRDEGLVFIIFEDKWFVTTAGNMFLSCFWGPVCWG